MGNYSAIITKIDERLTYHTTTATPARILDGFKYYNYPQESIDSEADLPVLRLFVPDFTEKFVPRAVAESSLRLKLTISTKRESGTPALIEAVEKVLDAIEVKHDGSGVVDALLAGTIAEPFSVSSENGFAESVSCVAQIVLTLIPRKATKRGKRRI